MGVLVGHASVIGRLLSHALTAIHSGSAAGCYVKAIREPQRWLMPELPEVETVRRGLEPAMVGARFTEVEPAPARSALPVSRSVSPSG